jgi:hypothetical protein
MEYETKKCSKCKEVKLRSGFTKQAWKSTDPIVCNFCEPSKLPPESVDKECSKCKEVKVRSAFSKKEWKNTDVSICNGCLEHIVPKLMLKRKFSDRRSTKRTKRFRSGSPKKLKGDIITWLAKIDINKEDIQPITRKLWEQGYYNRIDLEKNPLTTKELVETCKIQLRWAKVITENLQNEPDFTIYVDKHSDEKDFPSSASKRYAEDNFPVRRRAQYSPIVRRPAGNQHYFSDKSKSPVCYHFQRGHCYNGDNCTYRHEKSVDQGEGANQYKFGRYGVNESLNHEKNKIN